MECVDGQSLSAKAQIFTEDDLQSSEAPLKRGTIIYRVKLPLSLAFRVFSTDFCLPMFTVPLILLSQFVTTPGFRLSL